MKLFTILTAALLAGGCANKSVWFYETERFSLSVEGKPDSTEPISGNLGFKQRAVAVVPRRATTSPSNSSFDALSMISYFNLTKSETSIFAPIDIQTAFLTGDAAVNLDGTQAANALKAATAGFSNADSATASWATLDSVYIVVAGSGRYRNLIADLDALASEVPQKWPVTAVQTQTDANGVATVTPVHAKDSATAGLGGNATGFLRLQAYASQLSASSDQAKVALVSSGLTVTNVPEGTSAQTLIQLRDSTEKEMQRINQKVIANGLLKSLYTAYAEIQAGA